MNIESLFKNINNLVISILTALMFWMANTMYDVSIRVSKIETQINGINNLVDVRIRNLEMQVSELKYTHTK